MKKSRLTLLLCMLLALVMLLTSCNSTSISVSDDGYWIINGEKTEYRAEGKDGKNGQDGETPTVEISRDGYWVINGEKTKVKAKGTDGKDAVTPEETYIGYDGYLWTGAKRTDIRMEIRSAYLAENTIPLYGNKNFDSVKIDLSKNRVALMNNLQANMTGYSGATVEKITVFCESAGFLTVGTASVEAIRAAAKNGTKVALANAKTVHVVRGVNEIVLNSALSSTDTLVFGSDSDTAKLVAYTGVPTDDQDGLYTLLSGTAGDLIAATDGKNNRLLVSATVSGKTWEEHLAENEGLLFEYVKTMIAGKNVSILGDSISTYAGHIKSYCSPWFSDNRAGSDVRVNTTWWMRTVNNFGLNLLVNNSWSGSMVRGTANAGLDYENEYQKSWVRSADLSDGSTKPDIIFVFMGTNDAFRSGTTFPLGTISGGDAFFTKLEANAAHPDPKNFVEAYTYMMYNMRKMYPNADIFVMNLPYTNGDRTDRTKLTNYNGAMKTIAEHYGATMIDLYTNTGFSPDNSAGYTVDTTHPNAAGMAVIADVVKRALVEYYK